MFKQFRISVLAALVFCGTNAFAGVPVIDAAGLAQAIAQVQAWAQQFQQMQQQYQQLQQQFQQATQQLQSLTGAKNLSALIDNTQLKALLPPEYTDIASLLSGRFSGASVSKINGILTSYGYDNTNAPTALQSEANTVSNQQLVNQGNVQVALDIKDATLAASTSPDMKTSTDLMNQNLIALLQLQLVGQVKEDARVAEAAAKTLREAATVQKEIFRLTDAYRLSRPN